MTIQVDFATEEDLLALLPLWQQYAGEVYPLLSFDSNKTLRNARHAIAPNTPHALIVAKNKQGDITGYIYGSVGQHLFSADLACTMSVMYVSDTARGGLSAVKLMDAFRLWGNTQGAVAFYFSVASGMRTEQTHTFLQKLGFQFRGGNYSLHRA